MWSYFFGGNDKNSFNNSSSKSKELPKKAIIELREHINLLTKKQSFLETQILNQSNDARAFLNKGNKIQAKNSLKKRKIYENQKEKIDSQIESLEQQLFSIESANLNLETMKAMKQGAMAMKTIHKGINIDKVDETMDEIRDQVELSEEISEAVSRPVMTSMNDIDEDELDEELDMLAQESNLNESLNVKEPIPQQQQKNKVELPNVPNNKIEEPPKEQEEEEEDEDERALRELQAEMGL
ncbi:hypothetical protein NCAS_0A04190 [Naumovozyma castellii]|uniref:Vacuolar-sorting protein SNF7 n=1 Tax=Naumovozyma castellii TaxID=27288 RepID=G0V685_NAUCA|nr:hypothetical protein NCAS_0A04190 [Naumovozyma castellii CBS 4309]CCC66977.1 hypothetical protein NCAS_0A04190 [Naumovozyma castellii CBS 4309]